MKLNETSRTLIYIGAAFLAVGAAGLTHYATRPKPDAEYAGIGTEFYPEFQDPTAAQKLRVVAYDKDTALTNVFEVEYRDGKWIIPSHHDYPADGKDRLARTAASVIGTTKTALISRSKSLQARYDVVDPEDTDPAVLTGRGQKITIAKTDGTPLAEFVIGKPAEGQTDVYYVRGTKTEDPNAIYLAKLKIDLSTKFSDWIEPDLLKVDRDKLTDIRSDNYSVDEAQGLVVAGEITELSRKTTNDPWTLLGQKDAKKELKTDLVNQIVNNLDGLRLVGVRPKPQGVNPDLSIDKRISDARPLVMALESDMAKKGFYLAAATRGGQTKLVSKEGEFEAGTTEGIRYELHFGQIFTGTEFDIETGLSKAGDKSKDSKSAANKKTASGDSKAGDMTKEPVKKGRYLMVYTTFDPKLLGELPQKPGEPKKPNGLALLQHDDRNRDFALTALALADPKAEAKSAPAAKPNPASPGKSPAADKAKPGASAKPAPPSKPAPQADPKADYEKALAKYKKDVERYENDKSEYEKKVKKGEDKVKVLNRRFGPWYYVISAESFENLRLTHDGLLKPKENPATKKDASTSPAFPMNHP